ncbi:PH domain-containing protein [Pseudanabaena sp. UWO310]|uniref:PH domain-containing protein n=1 Tax=Pseudanabaena sp. UWO310 TaxID=2480795 RepID=UPI0011576918|nr:PH domain-containing protein [Pseudanabaena sp. UWO310]TYQ31250.1 PH domain-containing protein [Pseudanabaena sp. UWO310]
MSKVPLPDERILFKGHPAVIGSVTRLLVAIFTLGFAAIWYWLKSINTQYLITSQRIVIEVGIFSKEIETLEIYQIDDIHLEKPLNQRIMGTGNILLVTRDLSAPRVILDRLPIDVRELYEQMRPCIQQARFRYRVRDEENPRELL